MVALSFKEVKAASSACALLCCASGQQELYQDAYHIALKCKIPVYQNSKLANISDIFDCLCAVSTNQTDEPPCRATHTHTPSFPSASPCPPATFKCGGNFLVPEASHMTMSQGVVRGGVEQPRLGPTLAVILCFITFDMRMANSV